MGQWDFHSLQNGLQRVALGSALIAGGKEECLVVQVLVPEVFDVFGMLCRVDGTETIQVEKERQIPHPGYPDRQPLT